MPSLPQLLQEDAERIHEILSEFLAHSQADLALVAAEGGFVIFQEGHVGECDISTLGALAANVFNANQAIASLIHETSFQSVYQQGEKYSLLVSAIDSHHSLITVFPAHVSVGLIKYFAAFALEKIAAQLAQARQRAPGQGLDPAMLNLSNSLELFQMKKT